MIESVTDVLVQQTVSKCNFLTVDLSVKHFNQLYLFYLLISLPLLVLEFK